MKIEVGLRNELEVRQVYNPITLITDSGESLAICMRDGGFEFKYNGKWYHAKAGVVDSFENIAKIFKKNIKDELRNNERL